MKVIFENEPLIVKLIPRNYPLFNDIIICDFRNEIDNNVITISPSFTVNEFVIFEIQTDLSFFKIQNKYEFTIRNNNEIIYVGKMMVLKAGTDIQNYEYKTQNNEYYRFKE